MKTAVVTGAGGFLGTHWTRFLEHRGIVVHGFSRHAGTARTLTPDPSDPASLAAALGVAAPDVIFHFAGVADAREVAAFYRTNVVYAANLFAAAEQAGLADRPVVLVGTAAEYGPASPPELPLVEDAPCRPQSHYGISKLAQTQLGQAMGRAGRRVLVVRPTNILGPGMPEHMALQQFARQIAAARRGGPRTIATGDLRVRRDFIDVEDVCVRLWALCEASLPTGEIVNVCSGQAPAMSELLGMLVELAGGDVEVRTDPGRLRANDLMIHVGSAAKLERLVHPPALTPMRETLRRVLSACDTPETRAP